MAAITREGIWGAADELAAEGAKPTLNAVRKKLGGGSFTTISDAMTVWKERQRVQPVAEPLPADLATSVNSLAVEIWVAARDAAERALFGERERLAAEQTELREQVADAVELADGLAAEIEGLRKEAASATAARDKLAQDLKHLQDLKHEAERETQRAVERAMAKDLEVKDARIGERTALDRAGRSEGEVGALRDQLSRAHAAAAERDRLSQQLMDVEDQTEGERKRAVERVAGLESDLADVRKSERAALDRAARAEGEVSALREQLTQLTAALRDSRAGTAGRKVRREPS